MRSSCRKVTNPILLTRQSNDYCICYKRTLQSTLHPHWRLSQLNRLWKSILNSRRPSLLLWHKHRKFRTCVWSAIPIDRNYQGQSLTDIHCRAPSTYITLSYGTICKEMLRQRLPWKTTMQTKTLGWLAFETPAIVSLSTKITTLKKLFRTLSIDQRRGGRLPVVFELVQAAVLTAQKSGLQMKHYLQWTPQPANWRRNLESFLSERRKKKQEFIHCYHRRPRSLLLGCGSKYTAVSKSHLHHW